MHPSLDGPGEGPTSAPTPIPTLRRRASTESINLDYHSTYPVDDDILSRIRALLLSRNGSHPPMTPRTSEENPTRAPRENKPVQFDFSTAKSIAKFTQKATDVVKPSLTRSLSKSADMANDCRPSQTVRTSNDFERSLLRTSSSVNDLREPFDDDHTQQTKTVVSPSSSEPVQKSWFPKLVLRDAKAPETAHKSCVKISKYIPINDLELHEDELSCCPPCVPVEPNQSKYTSAHASWPGKDLMAEPADLVCFLASCPPGHLGCKKEHRIPSMSSRNSSQGGSQDDTRSKSESRKASSVKSTTKQIYALASSRIAKSKAFSIYPRNRSQGEERTNLDETPKFAFTVEEVRDLNDMSRGKVLASPVQTSPRSSITSADKFLHARQSLDTMASEGYPTPFSTSVATNFSLPGPRAKHSKSKKASDSSRKLPRALPGPTAGSIPWKNLVSNQKSGEKPTKVTQQSAAVPLRKLVDIPKDAAVANLERTKSVSRKLSNDSIRNAKPQSPSLRSGASKTSAYRHLLLKPSVTEDHPVDVGLPITPVLSTTIDLSELSMPPPRRVLSSVKESPVARKVPDATVESQSETLMNLQPVDGNGLDVQQPDWESNSVSGKAKVAQPPKPQDISILHSFHQEGALPHHHIRGFSREEKGKLQISLANDGGNSTLENGSNVPDSSPYVDSGALRSSTASSHAAYWGFVPTVKDVVNDAVDLAVKSVVSEAILPHGTDKRKASRAYRRAVADSLVEAAKEADLYLRRPSIWKDPQLHDAHLQLLKPCFGTSCLHDPHIGIVHCNTLLCEATPRPDLKPETLPPPESDLVFPSLEDAETEIEPPKDSVIQIPHKSAEKSVPENAVAGMKVPRAVRKISATLISGIPDRASSRQRASIPKDPGAKSDAIPSKTFSVPRPRSRSYKRVGSDSNHSFRSVSSIELLQDAEKKDQPEGKIPQRPPMESEADSLSYLPSNERLGRKNTLTWLRDLLSSTGPYEPRLTALPPRTHRGEDSSATRIRSQTAPALPVKQLFLGATPKPSIAVTQKGPPTISQHRDSLIPEALSKTIAELEDLLSEALVITRRAADAKASEGYSKIKPQEHKKNDKSHATKQSDEISLISLHESLRSFSGSSDGSFDTDENIQTRNIDEVRAGVTIVEEPGLRNHPSGWLPTGRVNSSYLPNTCDPSINSVAVNLTELGDSKTPSVESKNLSIVRKIDPRLMSIGSNLRAVARMSLNSPPKKDEPIEFQTLESFHGKRTDVNQNGVESYSPGRVSSAKSPDESDKTISKSSSKLPMTLVVDHLGTISPVPLPEITPRTSKAVCRRGHSEDDHNTIKRRLTDNSVPIKHEKQSSPENPTNLDSIATDPVPLVRDPRSEELRKMSVPYSHSFDGTQFTLSEEVDSNHGYGQQKRGEPVNAPFRTETAIIREREIELRDIPNPNLPVTKVTDPQKPQIFELKNKRHISLRDFKEFSLSRSHKRQSIARDWSPGRKRFCATVACLSTALVGILVGIYAGETPAIQYWIVDFHHYTVLGNVFFFIGLSIPSFLFWPLPLLHGRKPYILGAMSLAMPLLFPQALAVGELRSPYTHVWRVALIVPRSVMGLCLGFANMNFKGVLTDLFGASLQSTNPHQEHVDEFDVRRHGGGMGVWLGLWTWSAMGSIGVGFLLGAAIINHLNPAWGFYISITIIAFILLLNVLTPEVRRSAFRRSVTEVKNGDDVSRRLARGEVKMHMVQTGPKWWGEEFCYGLKLSYKMLRQPGFMIMASYVAWMYGQIVLIVLLLASLCSNTYRFQSPQVGLAVASVPLGAFVAIPFQKASLFSRDRNHAPISDDDTYKKKFKWTSHFVRRAIFVLALPFAGLGYTLSSGGAHIPFILPILFAALIGFLSNLAMAECHGIIMETYDTSDLSSGMTGRSRGSAGGKTAAKRTNYSSFPRVASAFGITQGLGYLIGAIASGVGGTLTRNLGQQAATGVMAFILLLLSVLLLGVLIRFKDVQIIPDSKKDEMDRYHSARRKSIVRREEGVIADEPWRPIIIGNPHHSTRRMCVLELGSMSRFSEIRIKNRLVDEQSLEARHPNQQMMMDVRMKIKEKEAEIITHVRRSLSRHSSRGSRRSAMFSDDERFAMPEQGDLGGHREVGRMRSDKKAPKRRATGIRE